MDAADNDDQGHRVDLIDASYASCTCGWEVRQIGTQIMVTGPDETFPTSYAAYDEDWPEREPEDLIASWMSFHLEHPEASPRDLAELADFSSFRVDDGMAAAARRAATGLYMVVVVGSFALAGIWAAFLVPTYGVVSGVAGALVVLAVALWGFHRFVGVALNVACRFCGWMYRRQLSKLDNN